MVSAQYCAPPLGEHVDNVPAQVTAHVFAEQSWPDAHVVPHAPQLLLSELNVTQRPLHAICPVGHLGPQVPAEQTSPAVHVTPHIPQFIGSDRRSTQLAPQRLVDALHGPASTGPTSRTPVSRTELSPEASTPLSVVTG